MTKQNPDILCNACKEFDKNFESNGVRIDVLVHCDHDDDSPVMVLREFILKAEEKDEHP